MVLLHVLMSKTHQGPAPSGEVRRWLTLAPQEPGNYELPSALSYRKVLLNFTTKPHTSSHGRGQWLPPCCWERQCREPAKAQPYLSGIGTSTSLLPYPYEKVYTPLRTLPLMISDTVRQPRVDWSSQCGYIITAESIGIRGRRASNFHCHHHLKLTLEDKFISSSQGEFKIEHMLMLEFKAELCFLLNL